MFGLLYTALVIGANIVNYQKQEIHNSFARGSALDGNKDTYLDARGFLRLASNNRPVRRYTTMLGHDVIEDLKTGQIYKDYTYEEQKKQLDEENEMAKKLGRSSYVFCKKRDYPYYKEHPWHMSTYMDFVDVKTGEHMKVIEYNRHYFYVSIETGKIIRPTDYEISQCRFWQWHIPMTMEILNHDFSYKYSSELGERSELYYLTHVDVLEGKVFGEK